MYFSWLKLCIQWVTNEWVKYLTFQYIDKTSRWSIPVILPLFSRKFLFEPKQNMNEQNPYKQLHIAFNLQRFLDRNM